MKENNIENKLPSRPKTLKDIYDLVVALFPEAQDTEEEFIKMVVEDMSKDGLRTRTMREMIADEKLNLPIEKHVPLNDFRWASIAYLKKLNAPQEIIKKLDGIFLKGFS